MQYTQGDLPRGRLEEVIVSVPAPGRSLRSVGSRLTARIEVRDCQWWTEQAVAALIQAGIVHSRAMGIVDAAPPILPISSLFSFLVQCCVSVLILGYSLY
ncbi:uncharacterized protein B0H18DRAFT_639784 [Fomitopsis serialis]|uniref:uncharacterized protein n=1 Tax=Fomitopsis serialis TaxID=139415 RepID=UPI0020084653|nr:uncharacterized protein B0H18DRAFT_639784 [Neoantrodia serialis]KAH9919336.1 hypothetical protein B0H18DRAFT_639784 [Neoantrodia serialis]